MVKKKWGKKEMMILKKMENLSFGSDFLDQIILCRI